MTILALEFSSSQRSVAVARGGRVLGEVIETGAGLCPDPKAGASSRQAGGTQAFGMIETALHEARMEREQIEVLAVGLGPGSYTGIRVALSIAQGWQLARGAKLLGVSSVDCLAAQARAERIFGRVNVMVDAQRNEFYLATYEISADGWNAVEPLRILTAGEIQSRAEAREILIGPEVTCWFPSGRTIFPRAATLARLTVERDGFVAGEKLEPIYLREANFVKAPARKLPAL
ncbi:MAG: tRNA (adenosine(37)-N6)-threonylcarbamoyltransferase complex dimerization subunit type 1 TsaB [Verrucomicrobiota bacterium]|jgi:tRNA threonylcarbamoyladenosine biosynthesis protein TsaB